MAGDADWGKTTVPSSSRTAAACAIASAWLPAEAVTIRVPDASGISAVSAPLTLNEPVGWSVSIASTAPSPSPCDSTIVTGRTSPAIRVDASSTSARVGATGRARDMRLDRGLRCPTQRHQDTLADSIEHVANGLSGSRHREEHKVGHASLDKRHQLLNATVDIAGNVVPAGQITHEARLVIPPGEVLVRPALRLLTFIAKRDVGVDTPRVVRG